MNMKTLRTRILLILLTTGFAFAANAQLLYQWAFTNAADTAISSAPSVAAAPGTGQLGLQNASGDAINPGLIFFTNANYGPPGGPGGALVLNGQGYNGGNSAVATNSSLDLGTLYQFTVTYWVQYGTDMSGHLSREVQFGASVNYDEGGKGPVGNHSGVGTALNGSGSTAATQFQDGIANAAGGANPQVTITGDPNFPSGFLYDGQTWYFEAVTYNGLLTANNFTVWLASTNAGTATGTPGIDPFVGTQNLGGIPFTTNASLILAGCAQGGPRGISTGQISDVRIYNGVLTSNQLFTVRWFGYPVVTNPPSVPQIVQQPHSGGTFAGANRTFSVVASGVPDTFTYLWRSNNVPIAGATHASFTLTNVSMQANGASFVCSVSNVVGGFNSAPAVLTVVPVVPGSYTQAALTNQPYALWLLNEATNAANFVVSDYANGNDGQGVNPVNMLFESGASRPLYPGFPANNTAIEVVQGTSARLNMPALPAYANTGMTLCGWIYTPTMGTSGNGLIFSLPSDTANGFGMIFGAGNELDYQWGAGAFLGSGLIIPSAEWAFVALVVSTNLTQVDLDNNIPADTNATLYVGSISEGGLFSYTVSAALTGYNIPSGTSPASLALGRTTFSSSENGGYYETSDVRFNDVAVFYQGLSPQTITNLYVAGAGMNSLPISAIPDPSTPGNLLLTWIVGTLQEATVVTGPYTDVASLPASPYSAPMTEARHFYRLRQ